MITPEEVKSKTPERFWNKIKFGELNECWIWLGCKTERGYGQIGMPKKVIELNSKKYWHMVTVHRFMYENVFPDFNPTLCVLHSCDNRPCCNPNHLWQGTKSDNAIDMYSKNRQYSTVGSKHGMAKLTEADIPIIRKRLASGEFHKIIAGDYGVTKTPITLIGLGKTWKHVK